MSRTQQTKSSAAWRKAGYTDTERAGSLAQEVADLVPTDVLLDVTGAVADPDQALLAFVRLREALDAPGRRALTEALTQPLARARLFGVLGASSALGDHLVAKPEQWRDVVAAERRDQAAFAQALIAEIDGRDDDVSAYDALRVAYRRQLVQIAALDVTDVPANVLPATAASLADLAGAALEAGLHIATQSVEGAEQARLAVIGMGKTGGRELNYISDVDVIFVAQPADGVDEDVALRFATELATELMRACSASTGEGSLWQVDAALRPEGKQGPLVRTVASHRNYYERWAKGWEFQALLKARPIAGDREVGEAYIAAMRPMVWQASKRENFVEDAQAMRRRVESHVPVSEQARQIKLGPGGLRDIEFSVQLLQLVHGRTDERVRARSTLDALEALSSWGYVGRTDASALDRSYRQLRVLEHRIQLSKMRRTHLMPTSSADLRRLGRGVGLMRDPDEAVTAHWQELARSVRRLHEKLFYRPLLSAVARLDDDEAKLSDEGARDRLAALGYADPSGALRHLQALTSGLSRRAQIQRTLMPVILQWLADGPTPDAGLLAYRRISDELGTSHWYLNTLREGSTAELFAEVLSKSRYVSELLERAPESVKLFADPALRVPRDEKAISATMTSVAGRHDDVDKAMLAARTVRRTELTRIAIADVLGELDLEGVEKALTDVMAAMLQTGLDLAWRAVCDDSDARLTDVTIIGMGRFGGRELGYSSDADVMYVHRPRDGADAGAAQDQALAVVTELRRLAGLAGPDPKLEIDAALRPEGKQGPLVRSLDSYASYYERWSEGWEAQALLRAYPLAGDADLGRAFVDLVDPLRWPEGGISDAAVRRIRTLKARMEAERIPRGADPRTHFKLGRGGLSDVEWCVQLHQLQHAHAHPQLRRTGTISTLRLLAELELMDAHDAEVLADAWTFASRVRNASVLWRGRPVESLPSDLRDAEGIATLLGLPAGDGRQLGEEYRKVSRRARLVVDRVFYGEDPHNSTGPSFRR